MTLEELETQLKEMRDEGASGDTEIYFLQYDCRTMDWNELVCEQIDFLPSEKSLETIQIILS